MSASGGEGDAPTALRPAGDERSASSSAARFAPGAILAERYRIIAMLGRGGMGEVYRADDLRLGQTVALKFLPRGAASDEDRQRLVKEVRIGREIAHPNICRLYDIIDFDGQLFISMEYVDGEDLASLLRRIGRLPADKALSVARDLCRGVAAAHDQGIVHRDLKPANVMIDGRGRARITDFGLAAAGESDEVTRSAGTPAYMAPEQFAGAPASIKSDLYALGLILFEIFTGRRAIEASSLAAISERHKSLPEISVTKLAPGIDPSIEQTIRWCLAEEPSARPPTAEAVAAALPERDPLAAALAAGETPSPGLVAEAGAAGDLSHLAAWSAVAVAVAGVIAVALLAERTMVYHLVRLPKPPEVLRDRAKEIARLAAPAAPVADEASWMAYDGWRDERSWPFHAPPNPFLFAYRQSPRVLNATNLERRVLWDDPPHEVSGLTSVRLDADGRLMELIVVPPQREERSSQEADYDWSGLLHLAGIDATTVRPDTPRWAAPVDSDAKKAWMGRYPGGPQEVRIEAASYHGRPVWFSVLMPWARATRMQLTGNDPMMRIVNATNAFFMIALPIAALYFARRNLRRGRSDKRGAVVLGLAVFISLFAAALFRADHSANFRREWSITSQFVANSAFWGAMAGLMYIAAEPFIRRRWPQMLISWSRLISGRWRDPMIGRDVLIGIAAGIAVMVLCHSVAMAEWLGAEWLGRAKVISNPKTTTPLGSAAHVGFFLTEGIAEALIRGIGLALFLVLLRGLLRKPWLAATVTAVVIGASTLDFGLGGDYSRWIFSLTGAAAGVILLTRFGLLSVCAFAYAVALLTRLPITLDPASWFFGRSLVLIATLLMLAGFGMIVSLGQKPLFPRAIFED